MFFDRTANYARRFLPDSAFKAARKVGTLFLTPVLFSVRSGHALSALGARAVDAQRRPIPWLTYPAIDFLAAKDLRNRTILEFGAGQSTLWFSERAKSVTSFESNQEWRKYVAARVKDNTTIHLVPSDLEGARELVGEQRFDIVLVDGFERIGLCLWAQTLLKPGGALILDDSDGYEGELKTHPIPNSLREAGFMRADFYGYSPGVWRPHCTSVYFREGCFLFRGDEVPRRYQDE